MHTDFSQEAGQVVWYSHLFKIFPEFVVIHTIKGFSIVNEAELNVFLEFYFFFSDPTDAGNFIPGSSLFLNPAWTSGTSWFTYCWSLTWGNSEHYFTSMWIEFHCVVDWTFFGIAPLWDWNENWPFPVLWPLLNFPNLLVYWVQHFHCIMFKDFK